MRQGCVSQSTMMACTCSLHQASTTKKSQMRFSSSSPNERSVTSCRASEQANPHAPVRTRARHARTHTLTRTHARVHTCARAHTHHACMQNPNAAMDDDNPAHNNPLRLLLAGKLRTAASWQQRQRSCPMQPMRGNGLLNGPGLCPSF